MDNVVRKKDIRKDSKYYSYKYLGNFSGEQLYSETFDSNLYESDQQKAKQRQLIIDKVENKKINNHIHYEKIIDLTPKKIISYSINSNYDNKSLTVLGSDDSSITVNWKYDIINWFVNESTLTFREVDRSTNEQYDRTINILNGDVIGSRRVVLEERALEFVDPKVMGNTDSHKVEERDNALLNRSVRKLSFENVNFPLFTEFGVNDTTFGEDSNLIATVQPSPDTPPTGYENSNRHKACLRGLAIKVDRRGNVVSSAVHATDTTTNNLDLTTLLRSAGLVPTTEGSYSYIFEFFGWYTKGSPAGTPGSPGTGHKWLSDDTMYKIYEGYHGPLVASR